MKILFVLSTLQMGGAEKVAVELANRWANRYQVSLLTLDVAEDFFTISPLVERYSLNILRKSYRNPIPHIKMVLGIKKVAKKTKPDYVISFVGKTNVFVLLALNSRKYKIIACEHSTVRQDKEDRLVDFFRHRLYPKAYKLTVLSSSIKEDFIKKYKRVDSNRVVITPNALDILDKAKQDEKSFRMEVGKSLYEMCGISEGEGNVVVSLGRFDEVKRFNLLISIFAKFLNKYADEGFSNTRLVIFGEGSEEASYFKLISQLKMKGKIFIHKRISSTISMLREAKVYAVTSRFEGLSMSMLEAFYAKCPIVAFDVKGVRDLIFHNNTGILVDDGNEESFADAIRNLLFNQKLHNDIKESAYKKVLEYGPQKIDEIWASRLLV